MIDIWKAGFVWLTLIQTPFKFVVTFVLSVEETGLLIKNYILSVNQWTTSSHKWKAHRVVLCIVGGIALYMW